MIVGYVRVSVKENKGDSVINQISLIKEYCKNNNYCLNKIYIDNGVSGITYDRCGFKELFQDIKDYKISTIIVKDISRLGRDALETSYYINYFFSLYNVSLVSLDGFKEEVLINIKSILNECYVRDASLKRKHTAYYKTSNKEFIGAKSPYGYRVGCVDNKRTLLIDECEANIVRMIFKCRLEGSSFDDIASYLNTMFCSDLSNISLQEDKYLWNSLKVRRVLENVVYKGDLVVRKSIKNNYKEKRRYVSRNDYEIIENAFPPIISRDVFSKVNSMVKRYKKHEKVKDDSIYKELVYCSKCSIKMSYYQRYKNGKYQYYFKCPKCKKTVFLARINKTVEASFSQMLDSIDWESIYESVMSKAKLYLQGVIDKLLTEKRALYIKYKELYKRKLIVEKYEHYLDDLKKVSLHIQQLNKKINYYRKYEIDACTYDYWDTIDISCIVEKIEVNSLIKIYYHIKSA